MPSVNAVLLASAIAFFATANSHMVLNSPPPYGSPDNSPLAADGSNFPCKATSNSGGTVTNMAIGSPQQLSFKGEAVHGGGSCQVSLTKDTPATKNSQWQVIHSIEGGCPARNAGGNEGSSAGSLDPDTYNYTIPQGIDAGAYTLAWTWFNKIGNREMYMNCASIKVTGGSSKRDAVIEADGTNATHHNGTHHHDENCKHNGTHPDTESFGAQSTKRQAPSFPAMFVANIPTSDCQTADSANLQFPNPGSSVEHDPSSQLTPPTGPKCGSSGSSGSSSNTSSSSGSTGSSAGSSSAPSAAPGASGTSSSSSGSSPPVGSSSSSSSGGSGSSTPSTSSPTSGGSSGGAGSSSSSSGGSGASSGSSSSASDSGSGSGSSAGGTSSSSSTPCNTPGQSICSPDNKSVGMCTSSGVTFQPVAAGTLCQGGSIVAAPAAGGKRSARFSEKYFPRALGAFVE